MDSKYQSGRQSTYYEQVNKKLFFWEENKSSVPGKEENHCFQQPRLQNSNLNWWIRICNDTNRIIHSPPQGFIGDIKLNYITSNMTNATTLKTHDEKIVTKENCNHKDGFII